MNRNENDKNAWTDAVVASARLAAAQQPQDRLMRFVREYVSRVDIEDGGQEPTIWAQIALSHLEFAQRREAKQPALRVFNSPPAQVRDTAYTVVEIVNDDMPFLVDSTTMEINRRGLSLHQVIHPIYTVRRDAAGNLLELFDGESAEAGARESFIRLEMDRLADENAMRELREALATVLADVRAAVEDWPRMRERAQQTVAMLETRPPVGLDATVVAEARDFLAWMLDNHFVFLGYRAHDLIRQGDEDVLRVTPATGLGILRAGAAATLSTSFSALPPAARAYARVKDLLLITKSNSRSNIHRPGYVDYVGLKRYDDKGEVCGEHRFLGLYTHAAYSNNPFSVPVLRRKLNTVVEHAGLPANSHAAKSLEQILSDYPRDELFQIEVEELQRFAIAILQLGERQRLRLLLRRDRFERFVSCLIYVPREHYSTDLRRTWQSILMQAFNGQATEFNVHLSESPLARVLITVRTTPGALPPFEVPELESRLAEAARPWDEALRHALIEESDEKGRALFQQFERAFPAAYREDFNPQDAVADVQLLAQVSASGVLGMRLYRPRNNSDALRFKLVRRGEPITLSHSMPMLERMGLEVLEERPYRIDRSRRAEPSSSGADSKPTNVTVSGSDNPNSAMAPVIAQTEALWIHDFGLQLPSGTNIGSEEAFQSLSRAFEESFARVYAAEIENDDFNQLVLRAKLSAAEIVIVRAYAKYLRQIGFPLTQSFIESTLATHAEITRMLVALFKFRFDPERGDPNDEQIQTRAIKAALEGVANLNEDRVLRQYLALIQATLRTNFWRRDEHSQARTFLSFKFDPKQVPGMPEPRPLYEIFVYSTRFEGVHLRGGKVARGGLRWSDRPEDFRTEVLGLVKAQMVKNAIIVPVGSKGGFVLKRAPAASDREAFMKEGIACYEDYLRGLLDLTDNLVQGAVVPPPQVKRYDGDDPYLVVAADKGTASFSDYANAIAKEYGFWLSDAFASGGSAGYDHKVMGITARGAWESVKRHFRALGIDTQKQAFTVVGVGDMSGDVFGNGMLLSKHIRLLAAFDHRHIVIDPQPDAAASFVERERLFRLPRSSWGDYNQMLISKGGGVWARSAKSIKLSPQACAVLVLPQSSDEGLTLTPNDLVSAILKAPADLLYNGGIGTYVKAATESHAEVGDRNNDAVRIDGRDLRCKIVAEGGNLGFTQRGRIEYALKGGRINTDAIDNSAGVDASDHEVNIKILLGLAVTEGVMSLSQRNALLSAMTDEVAQLVLRDNYFQNQILALSEYGSARLLDAQQRFIRFLEHNGRLNRALEFLPDDEEIEKRRGADGALTRPEVAVLLAYSKMWLFDEVLESALPDDPWVATALSRYFPTPLREIYASYMAKHPLRREIVATHVVNSMTNRVGAAFVSQLAEANGAQPHEVVRAYLLTREVFGLVPLWQSIEALDNQVPAPVQLEMQVELMRLIGRATTWFLRSNRLAAPLEETIAHFVPGVETLFAKLHGLGDRAALRQLAAHAAHYIDAGVPADIAQHVAAYDTVYAALDIVEVAGVSAKPVEHVAGVWFALTERFGWEWLREKIAGLKGEGYWPMRIKAAMNEDLAALQRSITSEALSAQSEQGDPQAVVDAWMSARPMVAGRAQKLLDELRNGPTPDQGMLSVALREWRQLS
ncbi:MAG TPA: NAD-glutamate dehydrogenase [Burkholderiales bacterium]|nr:NAD-glutamate dehydrogenase [Burkholderiales bacterium]